MDIVMFILQNKLQNSEAEHVCTGVYGGRETQTVGCPFLN